MSNLGAEISGGEMSRKFNAYRNGKIHVCKSLCSTCIFRPDSQIPREQVAEMVRRSEQNQTAIICHSTLAADNAVCRGFYEQHKTVPLVLAERMGCIEWQA